MKSPDGLFAQWLAKRGRGGGKWVSSNNGLADMGSLVPAQDPADLIPISVKKGMQEGQLA